MKSGTHGMVKFKRLQRRLKLPLWQAIGLLEGLWTLTAKDAPRGDIGRFSNEDIAAWLEYSGDADEMVAALVASGWVDECSENRLVVHDWSDHAPNFVKGNYRDKFVEPTKTVGPLGTTPRGASLEDNPLGTTPPSQAKCSQAKPSVAKPFLPPNGDGAPPNGRTRGKPIYSDAFENFWLAGPKHKRRSKGKAWAAWKKALAFVDESVLIAKAGEYALSDIGKTEFSHEPAIWLNQKCWEDEPAAWVRNDTTVKPKMTEEERRRRSAPTMDDPYTPGQ